MRSLLLVSVALLAALALAFPAQATTCYTTSTPTQTIHQPSSAAGGAQTYYVMVDGATSIWVYQETNGIAGLQRDDASHSDVSNCRDGTTGDHDIF